MPGPSADTHRRSVLAAQAAAAKKGDDTVILDVGDIITVADTFVITSGTNARQVRTIAEEVERHLKEQAAVSPRQVEGMADATWVLLDYGDVVVHVFLDHTRAYYDLERLWSDAPRIDWEEPGGSAVAST